MQERRDMYIGLIGTIFGLFVSIMAWNLPDSFVASSRGHIYLPFGAGIIMLVFGIILFLKNYMVVKEKNYTASSSTKKEEKHYKLILITIILSLVYAFIFDKLGYIISTSLFTATMLFILRGTKKWLSNVIISVAFSLFIFYVFGNFLQIYLPTLQV